MARIAKIFVRTFLFAVVGIIWPVIFGVAAIASVLESLSTGAGLWPILIESLEGAFDLAILMTFTVGIFVTFVATALSVFPVKRNDSS